MNAINEAVRQAEDARNLTFGGHAVYDPHPVFDRMRAVGDVLPGGLHTFFDQPRVPGLLPAHEEFTVVGFEAAEAAFKDHESFSSLTHPTAAKFWGANILFMDEPDHRRYRNLAQPAFALKTMHSWEDRWLRPNLAALLDAMPPSGPVDLYHDYCAQFPVRTIATALGIAPQEAAQFHEWVLHLSGGADPQHMATALQSITSAITPIIAARRADHATEDVIGLLACSEVPTEDGGTAHLDDAEIMGFAILLLTAGAGTTYRTMGFLLSQLIADQDLLARVRADRSLITGVIEETLRWSPPVLSFERVARRDTELAGVPIPEGAVLYNVVTAANHDPRRWDDPHTWDPARKLKPHLAFGFGPHFCLGNQLARMELRRAVEALLDRFETITLDDAQPSAQIHGLRFRALDGLPAVVARA